MDEGQDIDALVEQKLEGKLREVSQQYREQREQQFEDGLAGGVQAAYVTLSNPGATPEQKEQAQNMINGVTAWREVQFQQQREADRRAAVEAAQQQSAPPPEPAATAPADGIYRTTPEEYGAFMNNPDVPLEQKREVMRLRRAGKLAL